MNTQTNKPADTVVVLDFETTGLSPNQGDRAIEIGAVRIEQGQIVARFQELMNPGFRISGFIENYTGITNAMLQSAPPCEEVMSRFINFIGDHCLVAHNASFDSRFLGAELQRIGHAQSNTFACSMLIARRLYPTAPNHQLGTLVEFKRIPTDGVFHRALADTEMTAKLWLTMVEELQLDHGIHPVTFPFMQRLSRTAKGAVPRLLKKASDQASKRDSA
jgi:DNA polymerase-3 subunit epsilon